MNRTSTIRLPEPWALEWLLKRELDQRCPGLAAQAGVVAHSSSQGNRRDAESVWGSRRCTRRVGGLQRWCQHPNEERCERSAVLNRPRVLGVQQLADLAVAREALRAAKAKVTEQPLGLCAGGVALTVSLEALLAVVEHTSRDTAVLNTATAIKLIALTRVEEQREPACEILHFASAVRLDREAAADGRQSRCRPAGGRGGLGSAYSDAFERSELLRTPGVRDFSQRFDRRRRRCR